MCVGMNDVCKYKYRRTDGRADRRTLAHVCTHTSILIANASAALFALGVLPAGEEFQQALQPEVKPERIQDQRQRAAQVQRYPAGWRLPLRQLLSISLAGNGTRSGGVRARTHAHALFLARDPIWAGPY